MSIEEALSDARSRMDGAIDSLKKDLIGIRTGRASISLLDDITVPYYGSDMPINQLATLAAPEPRMVTVQPWDKGALEPIERAITSANLGVTPQNDGNIIRIPIPQLTEERRKELVKQAKSKCEDAKVSVRNVRRDVKDSIEKLGKSDDSSVSEDDVRRGLDELQKITDSYVKKMDDISEAKEKDVLEF